MAEDEKTYEPGFVEWEVSEHNRLYLSGSDDEALLTRYNADVVPGGFTTFRTAGEIEIFDLQTPPLIEGFNASLNISTYFTVLISSGPSTCTATQSPVTLTSEFYIGSAIVHQATVSEVITRAGEPGAENFSTTPTDAGFVSAKPGDTMRLRLLINNECAATISVEWGGAESRSGGVIIEGMLYEPQFQVRVDDLGIAQIEFTPIMPQAAVMTTLKIWNSLYGGLSLRPINQFLTRCFLSNNLVQIRQSIEQIVTDEKPWFGLGNYNFLKVIWFSKSV